MGKKKTTGEYNNFLDGEKLRDNADIRTTLQSTSVIRPISPPSVRQDRKRKPRGAGKGGPKKPPLTHFLCLPLVMESSRHALQQGLHKLKQELETEQIVPVKAVRPVGTLHLTLGVMSLDEESLQKAALYLRDLDVYRLLRDISLQKLAERAAEEGAIAENLNAAAMPDTDALTINLESLVPMQAPHKTSILYAEPRDGSQRLLPFASALREQFTHHGFLIEDTRPLKLHATIINTIYAKPGGRRGKAKNKGIPPSTTQDNPEAPPHLHDLKNIDGQDECTSTTGEDGESVPSDTAKQERAQGHGANARSWMRFDATSLMDKYRGFTWAENIRIDRVQICKMGAKKIWSGGKDGEGEVLDEQYQVVCEKGLFE
jgi:activating signal cointegrator complex subunit 1